MFSRRYRIRTVFIGPKPEECILKNVLVKLRTRYGVSKVATVSESIFFDFELASYLIKFDDFAYLAPFLRSHQSRDDVFVN